MAIGVIANNALRDGGAIRQAALLFESLALWPLGEPLPHDAAFRAELEFLYDQQVLRDTHFVLPFEILLGPDKQSVSRAGLRPGYIDVHSAPFAAISSKAGYPPGQIEGVVRVAAMAMQIGGIDAVPVASATNERPVAFNPGPHSALELVLRQVPVPAADTPWEDIINFRKDPDAQTKLERLGNWERRIMAGESTPAQVEAAIREDLYAYEEHMRLHRMKINHGAFKTFVKTTAQVLEAAARLKFTDVADALFIFSERRLALLEAELVAPGRHLAYVVDARERFAGALQRTHRVSPVPTEDLRSRTEEPRIGENPDRRTSGQFPSTRLMQSLGISPVEAQQAIEKPDQEQIVHPEHAPREEFRLYLRASTGAVPARHVLVVGQMEGGGLTRAEALYVPARILPPGATPLEAFRQLAEHFGLAVRFGNQDIGRFIVAGLFPISSNSSGLFALAEQPPSGARISGSGYFREYPPVAGQPVMVDVAFFSMLNITVLAAELGIELAG